MTSESSPYQVNQGAQLQTTESGPSSPTTQAPRIEIAKAGASIDQLRQQAAGNVPDIRGESIVVPQRENMSMDQLAQQAQEQRVATQAEKEARVNQLMSELSPAVLEAKTPEELEEAVVTEHMQKTGESEEQARERYKQTKEKLIGLGARFTEWFSDSLRTSDVGELIRLLFYPNYTPGEGSSGLGREQDGDGKKITRGEFVDKIQNNPKQLGEVIKKAYQDGENTLRQAGLRLNEVSLQAMIERGDFQATQEVMTSIAEWLAEGDMEEKMKHWEVFSSRVAPELFENKSASFQEGVKTFIIEELVGENKFERYFESVKNPQLSASQTQQAA